MSVGIVELDDQHRDLMTLINALLDDQGNAADLLEKVWHLDHRVDRHFQSEEAFLRRVGYAGLDHHVDTHRQLLADFHHHRELWLEAQPADLPAFAEYLKAWFIDQVLEEDLHFKFYVLDNSGGSTVSCRCLREDSLEPTCSLRPGAPRGRSWICASSDTPERKPE